MAEQQVFSNPATGQEIRVLSADADAVIVESVLPPDSPRPPRHYHPSQHESFEVLEGQVEAEIGGERHVFTAGDCFEVPAGVVHEMSNKADSVARLRWETSPALRTLEFFEAVGRLWQGPLAKDGNPKPLPMFAEMSRFGDEIRLGGVPWPLQRVVLGAAGILARR